MANTKPKQQQLTIVPDEDALLEQYAGAGISNKATDNIVPAIRILQPLSPEIAEGTLPNAKPGDFMMGSEVIPSSIGFWFQPCHWHEIWFEFAPLAAGGGFITTHPWNGYDGGRPIPPPGATTINDFTFKMGANELIHYRQWAGIVWINKQPLQRIINFKSTGHTIAKNWMNVAREANRLKSGKQRPLFGHVYHLTSERITNNKGTWYQIKVGTPVTIEQAYADGIVDDYVATIGSELLKAFQGGEVRAAVDDENVHRQQDVM